MLRGQIKPGFEKFLEFGNMLATAELSEKHVSAMRGCMPSWRGNTKGREKIIPNSNLK